MRARHLLLILALMAISAPAFALGGPENVLVVQNASSPVSQYVAAYYITRRGIPAGNVVTISTTDSSLSSSNEHISYDDYTNQIEQPIRQFLMDNNLADQIQYIVLTKGIPIRLDSDFTGGSYGGQSIDSMLAGMDLLQPLEVQFVNDNNEVVDTAWVNRYWRAQTHFTHARFGGYLVTRLDGYTEADAEALVDRALADPPGILQGLLDNDPDKGAGDPALQPKSLLLPDGSGVDETFDLSYNDYNADMTRASQILAARQGVFTTLETTNLFAGSPDPLSFYISWGSDDSHFNQTTYNSLIFTPRSIAETAVSSSGRTFLPTTGGQSLIADLITQGVAGAKGYVSEPFLLAIASPTVLVDYYTSGRNLAESFYAASRLIMWKDIVLGDPLCSLPGITASIASAKQYPDGTLVSLPNVTVTAGADDFSDRIYVQDSNHPTGILVYFGQEISGIPRDAVVNVKGILSDLNGERCLRNPSITTPNL